MYGCAHAVEDQQGRRRAAEEHKLNDNIMTRRAEIVREYDVAGHYIQDAAQH